MGSLCVHSTVKHQFKLRTKGAVEDIFPENIHWLEARRMLNNIGWKGAIPESWEQCKLQEEQLYELVLLMEQLNINISRIRDKQEFMDLMEQECFKDYKQYIDINLNENNEAIDECEIDQIDQIENGNPMTPRNGGDDDQNQTTDWCNGFENVLVGLCRF